MQMQFMGLRPDGWLEDLEAKKLRHRRKVRVRILCCAASVLLAAGGIWSALTWA